MCVCVYVCVYIVVCLCVNVCVCDIMSCTRALWLLTRLNFTPLLLPLYTLTHTHTLPPYTLTPYPHPTPGRIRNSLHPHYRLHIHGAMFYISTIHFHLFQVSTITLERFTYVVALGVVACKYLVLY